MLPDSTNPLSSPSRGSSEQRAGAENEGCWNNHLRPAEHRRSSCLLTPCWCARGYCCAAHENIIILGSSQILCVCLFGGETFAAARTGSRQRNRMPRPGRNTGVFTGSILAAMQRLHPRVAQRSAAGRLDHGAAREIRPFGRPAAAVRPATSGASGSGTARRCLLRSSARARARPARFRGPSSTARWQEPCQRAQVPGPSPARRTK